MPLAVLVLEMFLDVLYFHSCGIVGIMMVVIKLAHLCCLWIVCWMWALGFVQRSEEKTGYMNPTWAHIICENAVVSPHWTPWMLCAKKKKKSKAHLTSLHANGRSWSYKMWKKIALSNASRPVVRQDFCSGMWRESCEIYKVAKTHCTCMGTMRPQPGSVSISVNLLHGNRVWLVQTGVVRGVSRLCSAVNPVLYSISMLSSQTLDNAHTHQGVVVCFVWISLIVYV